MHQRRNGPKIAALRFYAKLMEEPTIICCGKLVGDYKIKHFPLMCAYARPMFVRVRIGRAVIASSGQIEV